MTQEYKENVLKYITGNLPQQTGVYDPQYNNVQAITNDLDTQISAYFSSIVTYVDFVPSKNNKNQNLDYSVIACNGTLIGESNMSGAYVILDKDYNIVEVITHYNDGSLIGRLQCLNVDDKGNFFAIEYYRVSALNVYPRIVLLNNLVLKPVGSNNYQAIVKEAHRIPVTTYNWDGFLKVFKNEGENKYFVVGNRTNSDGMVGCELTIGDSEKWTYYTTSYTKNATYAIFDNGYNVYWDTNSELHFEIAVNDYGLVMLSKGSGTSMVQTRYTRTEDLNQHGNFIFYSNKIGYYAYAIDDDPDIYFYIYKVDLETKQNTLIYYSSGQWASYSAIWLFKNNNSIYYYKIDLIDDDNRIFKLYFGLIDNIATYEVELGTFTAISFLKAFCYPNVITNYNNNYVYIQNQNTLFSLDFIWNAGNYNGQAYISSGSLVPNVITIQDNNQEEIFNRNIYNLSHYANWYAASVQVPNYYLNNINLNKALLYSKNNNILCNSNLGTTKNIYEELNINFINKFTIIDNETQYENLDASTNLVDYMLRRINSVTLNKIQINYEDETTETKNITTNDLVYSNLSTTYKILLYINKKISSIDLISEDELILYKTINCSNLEIGKYYLISQDIRIE